MKLSILSMKYLATTALICWAILCGAQYRYDNTMITGYGANNPQLLKGGTITRFYPELSTANVSLLQAMGESATISDRYGNLLFYTNGCEVFNRNHGVMANGDTLNPGAYYNNYCAGLEIGAAAYPMWQGVLILPWPGDEGRYLIFHLIKSVVPNDYPAAVEQRYSVVDMAQANGLGAVVEKGNVVGTGVFSTEVVATRHANGRDWWVMNPHRGGKAYSLFRFGPQGMEEKKVLPVTDVPAPAYNAPQSAFSPDGSWHAHTPAFNRCRLVRFDRCAGTASFVGDLDFGADSVGVAGTAFSPNSKVLYVPAGLKVFQFDLSDPDLSAIQASKQVVAEWEPDAGYGTFFQAVNGPDGKIYVGATNGYEFFHVIHHPDSLGGACQFEPAGLALVTRSRFIMPNIPHYRLFDQPGSPCDTLGINAPVAAPEPPGVPPAGLRVYPNPAQRVAWFEGVRPGAAWQVFDLLGRVVAAGVAGNTTAQRLDTANWPAGTYLLHTQTDRGGTAVLFQVGK
jgi:hypothetical protein